MGVLGVDQSVLLLRTGNDITKQDILNDLQEYGSGGRYYYRGRSSSEFFGSTEVFSVNNLFCVINGFDVNANYYYPAREYTVLMSENLISNRFMSTSKLASSFSVCPTVHSLFTYYFLF